MTGFLSRLAFLQQTEKIVWLLKVLVEDTPGGGGLPDKRDGDARRKIRIKPLKQTNLGVARALFDP